MSREPFVDQDMCISCGICVSNLPDVFCFGDNGKAECFDPDGASAGLGTSGAGAAVVAGDELASCITLPPVLGLCVAT